MEFEYYCVDVILFLIVLWISLVLSQSIYKLFWFKQFLFFFLLKMQIPLLYTLWVYTHVLVKRNYRSYTWFCSLFDLIANILPFTFEIKKNCYIPSYFIRWYFSLFVSSMFKVNKHGLSQSELVFVVCFHFDIQDLHSNAWRWIISITLFLVVKIWSPFELFHILE